MHLQVLPVLFVRIIEFDALGTSNPPQSLLSTVLKKVGQ